MEEEKVHTINTLEKISLAVIENAPIPLQKNNCVIANVISIK